MKKYLFLFVFFCSLEVSGAINEKALCRNGTFTREHVALILNSDNVLKDSYLRYGVIPDRYSFCDSYENSLILRNPHVELSRIKNNEDVIPLIEKAFQHVDFIDSDFNGLSEERVRLLLDILASRKIFLSENSIRTIHKKYSTRLIFSKLKIFPACPKDVAETYAGGLKECVRYTQSQDIIDDLLRNNYSHCLIIENGNLQEEHLWCIYEKMNQSCQSNGGSPANHTLLRSLCEHPCLTEALAREILRTHPSTVVRKHLIANMSLSSAFRALLIKTCPENFFYDTELLSNNYALFGEYTLFPCDYDELIKTEEGAFFVAGAMDTPKDVIYSMKKWPSTWYALLQNKSVSKDYLLKEGSFCLHFIKKIYDTRALKANTPKNMNDVVACLYFENMKNALMFFPNKSWELQDRLLSSFKGDPDMIELLVYSPSISPKVTDFFVQSFFDR